MSFILIQNMNENKVCFLTTFSCFNCETNVLENPSELDINYVVFYIEDL